jgi:NAD(P)-dependent dehydrogenase (short-subunit alcohol dehydrogenase family)
MAGRIAIILCGSSGIGRAGAMGFAWKDKSAAGADLKAEAAAAAAQDIRAGGFVATGVVFDRSAA